ncbi:MAG: aquaporin [Luteimonas sp.]|nr:aquaporin [Luteimonas sp.]
MVAEMLGTGFLAAAVVGSGIMATGLAGGNEALTLLANSLATAAALFALIGWLGPISGAHLNPVVTVILALRGDTTGGDAAAYIPAQVIGALIGVVIAHAMFDMPLLGASTTVRSGRAQWLGEFVSTFGLVGIVWVGSQTRSASLAGVVAAYIGGAFWFTPTDFANPALTLARALTDTFAGIQPADVPGFIGAEFAGAAAAAAVFQWLSPDGGHVLATPSRARWPTSASNDSSP